MDVFAFGLVVLELVTAKRMDHSHSTSWPSLLHSVKDEVRAHPPFPPTPCTLGVCVPDCTHYHLRLLCRAAAVP